MDFNARLPSVFASFGYIYYPFLLQRIAPSLPPTKKINPNREIGYGGGGGDGGDGKDNQEFCGSIKSILQKQTSETDCFDMASIWNDFNNNGRLINENNEFHIINKENLTPITNSVDSVALLLKPKNPQASSINKKCKIPLKNKENLNYCVFCRNNKERPELYMSHTVRNNEGKTVCPVLRQYNCPICHAKGDNAHTVRYCTKKPIVTMEQMSSNSYEKMYNQEHKIPPPSYRLGLRM